MNLIDKIEEVYLNRRAGKILKQNDYAVLIPVVDLGGVPHLLYEVRAETLKTQPGEICFPGGAVECGENPSDTAVRETIEEIGLKDSQIRLLGSSDKLISHTDLSIFTYVAHVQGENYLNTMFNKHEVEELFLVPVLWLIENQPHVFESEIYPRVKEDFPYERFGIDSSYRWRRTEYDILLYEYPDEDKIRRIWGMTAAITKNFIDNILKNV